MRRVLDLLNWKKHPSNVWLIAGPLIALAVVLNVLRCILMCIEGRTLIPAYILAGGGLLAFFALRPLYRLHRLTTKKD